MSLAIDSLRYRESKTQNGNPYHECRTFRNAAVIAPIVSMGFDSFTGIALNATLEKYKIPTNKYKALTFVAGVIVDTLIFYGVGKLIDKLITNHRMNKADKLAEKQKI